MPNIDFFIHNGTLISMKRLKLEFTTNVIVKNIYYNDPRSSIAFGPREHNDMSVLINFHNNEIAGGTTNIGVNIEYAQGDKPQLKGVIWIASDNTKHPLTDIEVGRINDTDLHHG